MKRKRLFAGFAVVALSSVSLGGAAVSPAVAVPDDGLREHLAEFLDENGVDAGVREDLLAKYDAGERWDSISGTDPVSTETVAEPGWVKNVDTYADGSIVVTGVETGTEIAGDVIRPRSVSGCSTKTSGLTRIKTNCTVKGSSGFLTMWFTANYRYAYKVATDAYVARASISSVSNPGAQAFGGSFSDLKVKVTKATAAKKSPATARASMNVSVKGWAGTSAWLQLNVPCQGYALAHSTQFL